MAVQLEVRCHHCQHEQKLERPVARAESRELICENCERSISVAISWSQVVAATAKRPPVLSLEAR